MAWGFLDRFVRPRWLLDRILLVAEHVAERDAEELPSLLIDTLREQFGAQHACIHFADPCMLPSATREAMVAACPAASAIAADGANGSAEAPFWQFALANGKVVTASTTPAAIQDQLRPLLQAVGARDGIAIPLIYRGTVYAVANLYFKRTVSSKLATAENVMRSIRLLGNLVYSVLQQEYSASALQEGEDVVLALAQAIATRDGYDAGHVQRVYTLASELGRAVGLSHAEQIAVCKGAMLRDIGKLYVPDYLLQKPGPLDAAERAFVREHPVTGANMLLDAGSSMAPSRESPALLVSAIRSHHERLDGSGYPDGLTGSDVPAPARIVAIVDVYAALTADRPYRAALPQPRAVQVLQEMAGLGLDAELVSLFLSRGIHTAVASGLSGQLEPAAPRAAS